MSWTVPGRYDFSIPEAQRLSDLSGIEADLDAVIRMCGRWINLSTHLGSPTEESGTEWWERVQDLGDLGFAAVVRYGRTFGSGARGGLPSETVANLGERHATSHSYFKALRDKFIAHSVSELEDNQVFVMLKPQFGEPQAPAHITVDRGRFVGLGAEDIERLRSLSEGLCSLVKQAIAKESEKLLAIARGMPIEEIKARSTEALPIPTNSSAFKVRGKFSRGRRDG